MVPNFDNVRHRVQIEEKIENTGVALAVHRLNRRCCSIGLLVANSRAGVGIAFKHALIERRSTHAVIGSAGFQSWLSGTPLITTELNGSL
jgi:hypothetical protein